MAALGGTLNHIEAFLERSLIGTRDFIRGSLRQICEFYGDLRADAREGDPTHKLVFILATFGPIIFLITIITTWRQNSSNYGIGILYPSAIADVEWTLDPTTSHHSTTLPPSAFRRYSLKTLHPAYELDYAPPFEQQPDRDINYGLFSPARDLEDPHFAAVRDASDPGFRSVVQQRYLAPPTMGVHVDGVDVRYLARITLYASPTDENDGIRSSFDIDNVALAPQLGNRLILPRLALTGWNVSIEVPPKGALQPPSHKFYLPGRDPPRYPARQPAMVAKCCWVDGMAARNDGRYVLVAKKRGKTWVVSAGIGAERRSRKKGGFGWLKGWW